VTSSVTLVAFPTDALGCAVTALQLQMRPNRVVERDARGCEHGVFAIEGGRTSAKERNEADPKPERDGGEQREHDDVQQHTLLVELEVKRSGGGGGCGESGGGFDRLDDPDLVDGEPLLLLGRLDGRDDPEASKLVPGNEFIPDPPGGYRGLEGGGVGGLAVMEDEREQIPPCRSRRTPRSSREPLRRTAGTAALHVDDPAIAERQHAVALLPASPLVEQDGRADDLVVAGPDELGTRLEPAARSLADPRR
jgi:hypothetical protein